MKKFIAFYMVSVAEMEAMKSSMDAEAMKQMNEIWKTWMEAHKDSFIGESPMLGKNKRVTKEGVQDVRNDFTGFSVVQAESHEDAAKLFQDSPHLQMPGAYIEVLEQTVMPGM